jgi:hypothetical protein
MSPTVVSVPNAIEQTDDKVVSEFQQQTAPVTGLLRKEACSLTGVRQQAPADVNAMIEGFEIHMYAKAPGFELRITFFTQQ